MDRMIMIEFKDHKYMNYVLLSETFESAMIDHKTYVMEEDHFHEIAIISYCADGAMHFSIVKELKKLFEGEATITVLHCL